jgi:Heterokaryon incompatibility protein (HET)
MSKIVYESTGEIGIDNSVLSVNYNLHDALEMLRSRVESNSPEYFWIDAICINQADMKERTSQVSLMDQIIWIAQEVILAKNITLVCGNEQLPWEWVSNTVPFLITAPGSLMCKLPTLGIIR